MASFVVVVVGFGVGFFFFFFWRGGGGGECYVLFEKKVFCFVLFFFNGKSVKSVLCSYYYMCMFV